jgi:amino acid transporter
MSSVPGKTLSLFDAICLIVGIIIGAGIYETTPAVAGCMGGPAGVFFIWSAGGLLALCGALCYAELASAYPQQGGDYVYLNKAYGSWAGFLFGWSQLVIIRPGDIALMAYVFARYASSLYAPIPHAVPIYAAVAVAGLTIVNALGVQSSRRLQNILTVLKVAGLLGIAAVGLAAPAAEAGGWAPAAEHNISLALILVLFTYGGWSEIVYVAAETRTPQRTVPGALILGTLTVTVLYLILNGVFLHVLGYEGLSTSGAVAVDTVAARLPGIASRLIGIIICISALGAVNGLVFSGARITFALGADHAVFHRLGRWSGRLDAPVAALLLQGVISFSIVLLAGSFLDTILYSAPAVWLFFLASGVALFRLRRKDAGRRRPWMRFGYPVIPLIFCGAAAFMFCSAVAYAYARRPVGLAVLLGVMAAGTALYACSARAGKPAGK